MNNEEKFTPQAEETETVETLNSSAQDGDAEGANEEKCVDWEAEAKKNLDLFLRTQAEMENMKKRLEREKNDFVKFANESLIKDLLPVLDNLERALEHAENNCAGEKGFLDGVKLTYEGLKSVLEKNGVKQICSAGEAFDPTYHEAVMQQENQDVDSNTVLAEIQKGYLLNERLIRPAMVIVSKK